MNVFKGSALLIPRLPMTLYIEERSECLCRTMMMSKQDYDDDVHAGRTGVGCYFHALSHVCYGTTALCKSVLNHRVYKRQQTIKNIKLQMVVVLCKRLIVTKIKSEPDAIP